MYNVTERMAAKSQSSLTQKDGMQVMVVKYTERRFAGYILILITALVVKYHV